MGLINFQKNPEENLSDFFNFLILVYLIKFIVSNHLHYFSLIYSFPIFAWNKYRNPFTGYFHIFKNLLAITLPAYFYNYLFPQQRSFAHVSWYKITVVASASALQIVSLIEIPKGCPSSCFWCAILSVSTSALEVSFSMQLHVIQLR